MTTSVRLTLRRNGMQEYVVDCLAEAEEGFTIALELRDRVHDVRHLPVVHREMPLVLSPVAGRRDGGGYVLTNPGDPAHMNEHCRQAAIALRGWINRYDAALKHVGGSVEVFMGVAQLLDGSSASNQEVA